MRIKKIGVYVFPKVEELDFAGVYEVLAKSRAMKEDGTLSIEYPLQVDILASEESIECANGLVVKPHKIIDNFQEYDMIIVPGGRGIRALIRNKSFLRKIKRFSEEHIVCAVCTGALVLAEAGVLEGKTATTHHNHKEKLKRFCKVADSRVVVDSNVITAGGVSCSLDLGLKILETIYDKKTVGLVANRLEIAAINDN
ncbi:MAG: DJ-1/PfpI family protein [Candidatus Bathyarchaeota archaeon]|nr:DJ-1/PfpI family protein [Candidatus Bathyarchaeota archaeon]